MTFKCCPNYCEKCWQHHGDPVCPEPGGRGTEWLLRNRIAHLEYLLQWERDINDNRRLLALALGEPTVPRPASRLTVE